MTIMMMRRRTMIAMVMAMAMAMAMVMVMTMAMVMTFSGKKRIASVCCTSCCHTSKSVKTHWVLKNKISGGDGGVTRWW